MTKSELFAMSDISIFYQYLALGKTITFNNTLANFELTMTPGPYYRVFAKNMNYPEFEPYPYDDMLSVGNILGIIDYLKHQPSTINPHLKEDNLWQEIKTFVWSTVCLNKANYKTRQFLTFSAKSIKIFLVTFLCFFISKYYNNASINCLNTYFE